ncbi:MAG: SOS response-associated peptidase, partial [Gemmatimonadetes bacterium]|nr:SOS response-associated peptidase [Gemmatimonadota bacterium]NIR78673.1 SOS response-associated peptidase [Gemmatimonadota bacterium]NIT87179.1 SOS response-associated peptidase [Gemmatimonadota bacterium]NIU31010.1 SOS response-associated peptidase [Gemmatimonadota bacterium]NIU35764.1 SOS response-associated peptidase [Gemmatimonadota bacterium]
LEALIATPPGEEFSWHPVSTVVNSPRNDVPECVEPLSAGADA